MIASSVACIVALIVSILGLARALFDVTWPVGKSGENQICLQIGKTGSDQPASGLARAAPMPASQSLYAADGLSPTITPVPPTATPSPTITPGPPTPTPTALVPAGALSTTVPITAQVVYSAGMDHLFQVPLLLEPEPDAQLQSEVHFQWQWDGQPLPEGWAFDLLIWSDIEDEEHHGTGARGVVDTDPSLERSVDLDYVETIIEHGGGTYYWAVIVVQAEPYKRLGAWSEKRPFTYMVPEPPSEQPTRSP